MFDVQWVESNGVTLIAVLLWFTGAAALGILLSLLRELPRRRRDYGAWTARQVVARRPASVSAESVRTAGRRDLSRPKVASVGVTWVVRRTRFLCD